MKLGVSYIPTHYPSHLETDMKYIKKIGCTDILFAVQENHFQWLNGAVRFGPKIAKDNGLFPRAVIWGYANTSGGGKSSRVMLENPDMWRCDENGVPYGGGFPYPKMCYNNPKSILMYSEYLQQCRDSGFEGIMIDEPREQECFCEYCKNKFEHEYGGNLVESKGNDHYKHFQYETVFDFVKKSCITAKSIDKNFKTSLCLMPVNRNLFAEMVNIAELNIFSTDPYWLRPINKLTLEKAIEVSLYAKKLARENNKEFELYLGCFGISAGLEEKIYSEGKVLVNKVQPDMLTTWSFKGGIGLGDLSSEECDNPLLAWDNVKKLYKEIKSNGSK